MASIEKGHITVGDISFSYLWERKAVKNYNLRVRRDGEVYVSTPSRTTREQMERFLTDKAAFVARALQRLAARGVTEAPLSLEAGEQLPICGVLHTVCHRIEKKPRVFCEEGSLILALPDPDDVRARERAFARFAIEAVRAMTQPLVALYAPLFALCDVPDVSVRQMKARFGTCFYTKGRISFSTLLLYLPRACVELTVCHELAHFRHHDHSAAFYACLARVLPDHKERRAAMRRAVLPRFIWDAKV